MSAANSGGDIRILQMNIPLFRDIRTHVTLVIISRIDSFGILVGELSEVKLQLLERVALVEKLYKLPNNHGNKHQRQALK
mmetsp:Transcript_81839/g.219796  ORF Transcript_81839/g.219796 Transcript_81839/m.219796 type:complete len:80 (-) Transcript_81839:27-266(-)